MILFTELNKAKAIIPLINAPGKKGRIPLLKATFQSKNFNNRIYPSSKIILVDIRTPKAVLDTLTSSLGLLNQPIKKTAGIKAIKKPPVLPYKTDHP